MSDAFRFELNRDGVRALLKSEEMKTVLRSSADNVQGNAVRMSGMEYRAEVKVAGTRAFATVAPDSARAYLENAQNNTLEKALGGG